MSRVLCRVDTGPQSGLGHLQRCLSIADALRMLHCETVFLSSGNGDPRRRIEHCGYRAVASGIADADVGTRRDWLEVIHIARAEQCDIAIVDSYGVGGDYFVELRAEGLFIVAIDDLARHPFAAHIVVNGAAGAEALPYTASAGDTRFLLGPRYALLGSPFWSVPERTIRPDAQRVLVSTGGGNDRGLLLRVLAAIDEVQPPLDVTAVRGPFAHDAGEVLGRAVQRHPLRIVPAPLDLFALMLETDLAVTAGGQTLYELAATGTPTVAVRLFDNQSVNLRALSAEGVVLCAGVAEDPGLQRTLSSCISHLIHDHAARTRMSTAGRRLVDGRGAERVAYAILGRD